MVPYTQPAGSVGSSEPPPSELDDEDKSADSSSSD